MPQMHILSRESPDGRSPGDASLISGWEGQGNQYPGASWEALCNRAT